MARWRLVCAHYLNTDPPQHWEYKEIDRSTGKQVTRRFEVPSLIDPNDPGDCNHKDGMGNGEVVVAMAGKTDNVRDIIFIGPPTPDMVPLDKEAEEISASFASKWKHPIESLPGNYSETLLNDLQTEVAKVQAKSNGPTQVEGLSDLMAAMATVMKQNAELLQKLANLPMAVEPATVRRA